MCNKTVYWESMLEKQLYLRRIHTKQNSTGTRNLDRTNLVGKYWGYYPPHLMSEQSFSILQPGTSRTINHTIPFAIYKGSLES